MPDLTPKPPRPFSLRLSAEERQALARRAGGMPLGAYVRRFLFPANDNGPAITPRSRGRSPVRDHHVLAAVLARLGHSELSASLRELARAANLGALPMTPETEATIQQACRDVAEMKALVMKALGIRER
ncbi:hypothetical protein GIW81_08515 [Hyphomicrobium sp. xq]|uniref:Uncharacterized protein n=1 Tax=Hyphomicrobium album TaxID=2665159 RepID=A0A6I3KFK9_9HYPH|nr:hypothetical protein [Hyphomicrobium album]MTD94375.1 hypothetical protein [Hyphomicrobium album]